MSLIKNILEGASAIAPIPPPSPGTKSPNFDLGSFFSSMFGSGDTSTGPPPVPDMPDSHDAPDSSGSGSSGSSGSSEPYTMPSISPIPAPTFPNATKSFMPASPMDAPTFPDIPKAEPAPAFSPPTNYPSPPPPKPPVPPRAPQPQQHQYATVSQISKR